MSIFGIISNGWRCDKCKNLMLYKWYLAAFAVRACIFEGVPEFCKLMLYNERTHISDRENMTWDLMKQLSAAAAEIGGDGKK